MIVSREHFDDMLVTLSPLFETQRLQGWKCTIVCSYRRRVKSTVRGGATFGATLRTLWISSLASSILGFTANLHDSYRLPCSELRCTFARSSIRRIAMANRNAILEAAKRQHCSVFSVLVPHILTPTWPCLIHVARGSWSITWVFLTDFCLPMSSACSHTERHLFLRCLACGHEQVKRLLSGTENTR